MKHKLIISDYDGTLTGIDHIISNKTVKAVKRWIESGGEFTIASGRQYLMIEDQVNTLGINIPIITRGGAEIVDPKTGEVIYSQDINTLTLQEFMQLVQERGFEVSIEKDGYIFSDYYRRLRFENIIKFENLNKFRLSEVPKLVLFALSDVENKAKFVEEDLIKKFPELHIIEIFPTEGRAWDVTSEKGTKHLAALELQKMLGVSREETVGVGDGYNDFPLLSACGFKVAMGNAQEDLKAIADVVVPTYQEDGVAVLIEKLLHEDK